MKKLLLLPIGVVFTIVSFAQDAPPNTTTKKDKKTEKRDRKNSIAKNQEEEEPVFSKHSIFGIKLNTDGYGFSYEKGKYVKPRRTTIYQIEFNEKKHPKEEKLTTGVDFIQFSQLIYGKANNFYQLKFGMGQQFLLGTKANKNGVSVSALGVGGASLGLLKPYYYEAVDPTSRMSSRRTIEEVIQDGYLISSAAGFAYGWGKLKLDPGLHAKTALRFDYGRFNQTIAAIEAGVNLEYYFTEVKQMAYSDPPLSKNLVYVKPKNLFFNAYISILFGKRK